MSRRPAHACCSQALVLVPRQGVPGSQHIVSGTQECLAAGRGLLYPREVLEKPGRCRLPPEPLPGLDVQSRHTRAHQLRQLPETRLGFILREAGHGQSATSCRSLCDLPQLAAFFHDRVVPAAASCFPSTRRSMAPRRGCAPPPTGSHLPQATSKTLSRAQPAFTKPPWQPWPCCKPGKDGLPEHPSLAVRNAGRCLIRRPQEGAITRSRRSFRQPADLRVAMPPRLLR